MQQGHAGLHDTAPKGSGACRGLGQQGSVLALGSKNSPSLRSLRRHLTLGILVRSRQSSAECGEKEAHSDHRWSGRHWNCPGPGKGLGMGGMEEHSHLQWPWVHSQARLRTACTYGFAPRDARERQHHHQSNICGARLTGQSSPRDSCNKEGSC